MAAANKQAEKLQMCHGHLPEFRPAALAVKGML